MRLIALIATFFLAIPAVANAQYNSYTFELNGRVIGTNPDLMSGPYGCDSVYVNSSTGQPICAFDEIATPQSIFRAQVAIHCGVIREGRRSNTGFYGNQCIGGYVAVGDNCPQRFRQCTYYRIVEEGNWNQGSWTVPASRIHELGNEMWIARPGTALMGLFGRCWEAQGIPNRELSRC